MSCLNFARVLRQSMRHGVWGRLKARKVDVSMQVKDVGRYIGSLRGVSVAWQASHGLPKLDWLHAGGGQS